MRYQQTSTLQLDDRSRAVIERAVQSMRLHPERGKSEAVRRILDAWGTANGLPMPGEQLAIVGSGPEHAPLPETPAQEIARLRKAFGLSQDAAADKVGIGRSTWSSYETGHYKVSKKALTRIRGALGGAK